MLNFAFRADTNVHNIGKVRAFLKLYIRAHGDTATHCHPAFKPNNQHSLDYKVALLGPITCCEEPVFCVLTKV
jgi:hypothetical protein